MSDVRQVPPPPAIVRPNPDFEDWVFHYAQVVCGASHAGGVGDHHLVDPCGRHLREARNIAYIRREHRNQT